MRGGKYVRELDRRCGEREFRGLLLMRLQIAQIQKDDPYLSIKKDNTEAAEGGGYHTVLRQHY